MAGSLRFGAKLGLLGSIVGVFLAIPYLFVGFSMDIVGTGATSWALILENVVPVLMLLMVGSLARRRGLGSSQTAVAFGIVYGVIAGVAHWMATMAMPHKLTLIHAMEFVAMAHGKPMNVSNKAILAASVLHPSFYALVFYNALDLALFGVVLGWIGGKIGNRIQPAGRI